MLFQNQVLPQWLEDLGSREESGQCQNGILSFPSGFLLVHATHYQGTNNSISAAMLRLLVYCICRSALCCTVV